VPAGELADPVYGLGVDAGVDEPLEAGAGLVNDAECRVAGARQAGCRFRQFRQQVIERELRAQSDAGVD
jgi:hypothetical protein